MDNREELKRERDNIVKGLELTYKRLFKEKKLRNSPFVVLKNGEIVNVSPDKMSSTIKYKR